MCKIENWRAEIRLKIVYEGPQFKDSVTGFKGYFTNKYFSNWAHMKALPLLFQIWYGSPLCSWKWLCVNQRWARSRSLILIFKITTGDLDLLGDLDQFQIDLDLWVIFDL